MRETMGHPQGNQRCRLFQDCFQKFQVIPLWNRGHVMFDCEVNNLLQIVYFLLSNQIKEVINKIFEKFCVSLKSNLVNISNDPIRNQVGASLRTTAVGSYFILPL